MNLREKFEKGAKNHTYQRVNSEFLVDSFVGYNDDGQMSMVITEYGKSSVVKSSKFIEVNLKKREDGKMALSFDLIDDAYKSMFIIFCKDIIAICEEAGNNMAISNALVRWKYWLEMFGKKKSNILTPAEIKGLIGELTELNDHFMVLYDETTAIDAWMGPLLGHKDFEIENTWYEVKSISENAIQVNISSLEQLQAEVDGHLAIVRLEQTSQVSNNAITLNDIVENIADKIINPGNRENFLNKLDNIGYTYDEAYNKYCFLHKGTEYYMVKQNFPRLTRECVNQAIGNVSYSIILNSINEFKEI